MAKIKPDIQETLTEEEKIDLEEKKKAAHREAQKRYRERKKNGEVKSGRENTFDKKEYDREYIRKNYHQVMVKMRDDIFEDMIQHIQITNENRTEFIKRAIKTTIELDLKNKK